MKDSFPIEFSFTFNNANTAAGLKSRTFIFPTFPAYFDANKYNQKCKVEFVGFGVDNDIPAESTAHIIFKGIKSNQFRLNRTLGAGNALVEQSFIPTPLTLILQTHDGEPLVANYGNLSVGVDNAIICDNLWGSSVEIEVRETFRCGIGGDANFAVANADDNFSIVMKITPISEEKCGCK